MIAEANVTDKPVENPSIAEYGKESIAYLKEAKGVLVSIFGNITSCRTVEEEEEPITCLRDNMAEIRDTAMQIREIARNINMLLFNE